LRFYHRFALTVYSSRLSEFVLGVIWKGDKLIEGVPEAMELLRKMVCIQEHPFFITIFNVY